jgi:hypothetical protein
MVPVTIDNHSLTATAALIWSGDLPRPLQQILFEAGDGAPSPARLDVPSWSGRARRLRSVPKPGAAGDR